jgi:hypothetical protein
MANVWRRNVHVLFWYLVPASFGPISAENELRNGLEGAGTVGGLAFGEVLLNCWKEAHA